MLMKRYSWEAFACVDALQQLGTTNHLPLPLTNTEMTLCLLWQAASHCANQGAPLTQETKQSNYKRSPRVSHLLIIAMAST